MDYGILMTVSLAKKCKKHRKRYSVEAYNEMNSRCQIDFTGLQSNPDGICKFILVYYKH
jgi:hypothetical protein